MTRRSAECPAPGCEFIDVPSLVAAHVNGTEGADHDWQRLPYDGPGAFLSAARAGELDGGDGVHQAPDHAGDDTDTVDDESTGDFDGEPASGLDEESVSDPDEEHSINLDPLLRAVAVAREEADGVEDLRTLDDEELADLFVTFSVIASRARGIRGDVRSAILDRIDEEREIGGTLGSVNRSTSTRRSLRDDETVRSALFRAGIDPREATSFDPDLVAERIEDLSDDAPIEETDVFELSESDHVRRASVNEEIFDDRVTLDEGTVDEGAELGKSTEDKGAELEESTDDKGVKQRGAGDG